MLFDVANDNFGNEQDNQSPVLSNTDTREIKRRLHDSGMEARKPLPIAESETEMCVSLWRSVILQAMFDASGKGGNAAKRLARAESNAWFSVIKPASNDNISKGQTDFEFVCEMANVNPARILKMVKKLRENDEQMPKHVNMNLLDGKQVFKKAN